MPWYPLSVPRSPGWRGWPNWPCFLSPWGQPNTSPISTRLLSWGTQVQFQLHPDRGEPRSRSQPWVSSSAGLSTLQVIHPHGSLVFAFVLKYTLVDHTNCKVFPTLIYWSEMSFGYWEQESVWFSREPWLAQRSVELQGVWEETGDNPLLLAESWWTGSPTEWLHETVTVRTCPAVNPPQSTWTWWLVLNTPCLVKTSWCHRHLESTYWRERKKK